MGVGLDLAGNLAAGVFSNSTSTADSVNLYDITNLNSPTLLAQYDFPTSPRIHSILGGRAGFCETVTSRYLRVSEQRLS